MSDCKKTKRAHTMSKGQRRNMRTGKLPFIIDTKQLDHVKPLGDRDMIRAYEKAEAKRAHLLEQNPDGRMYKKVWIKGKKVMQFVLIPTAHALAFS